MANDLVGGGAAGVSVWQLLRAHAPEIAGVVVGAAVVVAAVAGTAWRVLSRRRVDLETRRHDLQRRADAWERLERDYWHPARALLWRVVLTHAPADTGRLRVDVYCWNRSPIEDFSVHKVYGQIGADGHVQGHGERLVVDRNSDATVLAESSGWTKVADFEAPIPPANAPMWRGRIELSNWIATVVPVGREDAKKEDVRIPQPFIFIPGDTDGEPPPAEGATPKAP